MCAYVSNASASPLHPQVPAFTAYVSQFGGYYMDDWSISKKAIALLEVPGVASSLRCFAWMQGDSIGLS